MGDGRFGLMNEKINYTDEKERQEVISSNTANGLRLVEDQRHEDGNFLIFTNEPYVEPEPTEPSRDLLAEIDELEARIERLEKK